MSRTMEVAMGVVSFALALALAPAAPAEETWRLGTLDGVDVARVETTYVPGAAGTTSRGALSGGLAVERRLRGALSLESGVLLLQRVSDRTEIDAPLATSGLVVPVPFRVTSRQRFVEVPLLLKASIGRGALRAHVAAGPALQVRISGETDATALGSGPGVRPGDSWSVRDTGLMRPLVLAFEAGAGLSVTLWGRTAIHLAARYSPAVSSRASAHPMPGHPADTVSLRSEDLRIVSGVSFGL